MLSAEVSTQLYKRLERQCAQAQGTVCMYACQEKMSYFNIVKFDFILYLEKNNKTQVILLYYVQKLIQNSSKT